MKTIVTTTAQALTGITATLVGLTPQIVDSVSMSQGLKLMKLVGGVSNAKALMDFSNANQDALAVVAVACAFCIVRTIAKKVA